MNPAVAGVDRDVRDRLARLGEHHEVARAQRAEVGPTGLSRVRLLARRPRQGDMVLREYVFREPRAVEPFTRRIAAPDVLRADVGVRAAEDARGLGGRGRGLRDASPPARSRTAVRRGEGRRDVRHHRRQDGFGRDAEGRLGAGGQRKDGSDGDRAKPTARGREHAGSEGSFGAKPARSDNRLPRNVLRELKRHAESEERPLAATAIRRGETGSCNEPLTRGDRRAYDGPRDRSVPVAIGG